MALSWRVLRENPNKRTIEYYDIFKGGHLQEEIEALMHSAHSKEEFAAMLKKKLMYHYWARSEHEVVITSSPPYIETQEVGELKAEVDDYRRQYERDLVRVSPNLTVATKIDIFDQISMNWPQFVDYVWENA